MGLDSPGLNRPSTVGLRLRTRHVESAISKLRVYYSVCGTNQRIGLARPSAPGCTT